MTKKKDKPKYGLLRRFNKKNVREFIDFDYLGSLSDSEIEFLNKFAEEHYGAHFKNDGTDFAAPRTPARKANYDANNARNRDIWSQRIRTDHDDDTGEEPT